MTITERLKARGPQAMAELDDQYGGMVFRVALRSVGSATVYLRSDAGNGSPDVESGGGV